MMEIPTKEPETLVAGDTWTWRRDDLVAYAADGWSLTYRLLSSVGKIQIAATIDADGYLVNVPAADTAGYDPDDYAWQAHVAKDGDRHLIGSGVVQVSPNFDAMEAHDTRTHAKRCLDNIEAVLERRSSKDQDSYTIEGRRLDRTPIADLLKLRDRYRIEVQRETGKRKRHVAVRFVG